MKYKLQKYLKDEHIYSGSHIVTVRYYAGKLNRIWIDTVLNSNDRWVKYTTRTIFNTDSIAVFIESVSFNIDHEDDIFPGVGYADEHIHCYYIDEVQRIVPMIEKEQTYTMGVSLLFNLIKKHCNIDPYESLQERSAQS